VQISAYLPLPRATSQQGSKIVTITLPVTCGSLRVYGYRGILKALFQGGLDLKLKAEIIIFEPQSSTARRTVVHRGTTAASRWAPIRCSLKPSSYSIIGGWLRWMAKA
jgi:hypothetical protein